MPEIFNDPEFEKYRVLEIEEGVLILRELALSLPNPSPDYFRGAIYMLKRIINLPMKMVPVENQSQKKQAEILKAKAFDTFEAKMMRKFVLEDE